jgi:hypothetical protein
MIEVLAVVAIVVYVVGRQVVGEPLRGKRVILLPAILTVIGIVDLGGHHGHVQALDVIFIAISAAVAIAIGLAQGLSMRLESRDGGLWGQLPVRALWLWVALILTRVLLIVVAHGAGAELAASSAPILMTLGLNRLAQALVIGARAVKAGIPFAPEKDGKSWPNLRALQGPSRY